MRAFQDTTKDTGERASERMNFRTKPHIKRTIQQAAALCGVDDSVFTMNAAYTSALAMIETHGRTMLDSVDHAAFFAALDNPPAPGSKLRDALERHRSRVSSK